MLYIIKFCLEMLNVIFFDIFDKNVLDNNGEEKKNSRSRLKKKIIIKQKEK